MAVVIQKIKYIKINEILPNPYQIRRNFDRKELFELADSIKENGILSPIIVRGGITGYELICGQRRLRAASIAGKKEVPAVIIKAGDAECAELSLIENTKRRNLSFYEEAEGYFNLLSYHRLKKDKIVKKLSTDAIQINERIRILSLSEQVRFKLEENGLSEKYARALLKIHDENRQLELIDEIIENDLTFKDVCKKIKSELRDGFKGDKKEKKRKSYGDPSVRMPIYINTINKTLELLRKSGAYITEQEKEEEEFTEFVIRIHKI